MPKNPDFPQFIRPETLTQEERDYLLSDIDFGGIDHEAFLELLDEPDDRGTGRLETSANSLDGSSAGTDQDS